MARTFEVLVVLAMVAFAYWAAQDDVVNGKEIVVGILALAYIGWGKAVEDWHSKRSQQ